MKHQLLFSINHFTGELLSLTEKLFDLMSDPNKEFDKIQLIKKLYKSKDSEDKFRKLVYVPGIKY